ncbi:dihydrofolate reductase [Geodermatophilus sabuli]|uniref:Dihydrofolate reductase n=1 Tax=Geodermatophilus sabuli TaxID=1564158 RepID=A0A7K3W5L6_9ACTN|nr:dihydrofolate reductase [Geodermatophilus sabuli]
MRSLVVTEFTSLDGVVQAPGGPEEDRSGGFTSGGWLVPFFDETLGARMVDWVSRAEDFLLGRGTYEIFAGSWPHAPEEGDPIATALNTRTKHVASRSLTDVGWSGARLVAGDVVEAVRALRAQDGGELQVHGSPGLCQTLLREDLVDELRLVLAPVVLGPGKRLFGDGITPGGWQLTDSQVTPTGVLLLSYRRAGDVATGEMEVAVRS